MGKSRQSQCSSISWLVSSFCFYLKGFLPDSSVALSTLILADSRDRVFHTSNRFRLVSSFEIFNAILSISESSRYKMLGNSENVAIVKRGASVMGSGDVKIVSPEELAKENQGMPSFWLHCKCLKNVTSMILFFSALPKLQRFIDMQKRSGNYFF